MNGLDFNGPITTTTADVLNDFDFDSFLNDDNGAEHFDFNGTFAGMEGNEIGAD